MINNSSSVSQGRSEGIVFGTAEELIGTFDAEYKRVPSGLLFEQGGYLKQGTTGWELYIPSKTVRLQLPSDTDKLNDINFGFYAMNLAGEEGILLKVSARSNSPVPSVSTPLLQSKFLPAHDFILHNGESFVDFVLKLGHNGDMANMDAG